MALSVTFLSRGVHLASGKWSVFGCSGFCGLGTEVGNRQLPQSLPNLSPGGELAFNLAGAVLALQVSVQVSEFSVR